MPTSRDQTYLTYGFIHPMESVFVVAVPVDFPGIHNGECVQVSPTPKPFGTLLSPSPVEIIPTFPSRNWVVFNMFDDHHRLQRYLTS